MDEGFVSAISLALKGNSLTFMMLYSGKLYVVCSELPFESRHSKRSCVSLSQDG